jgi:hypothetical protein
MTTMGAINKKAISNALSLRAVIVVPPMVSVQAKGRG